MSTQLQDIARDLLDEVNAIDPGMEAGSTFSTNERQAKKLRAVALHNVAYGVRCALLELGLFPESRTSCFVAPVEHQEEAK